MSTGLGRQWAEAKVAAIDDDKVYMNIGAYDPEALAKYKANELERLTAIGVKFENDPEEAPRMAEFVNKQVALQAQWNRLT